VSPSSEAVFQAAVGVPVEERVVLAEQLLDSVIDSADQAEVDRAWTDEIQRRLQAYRADKSRVVPAEEVCMKRLHQRFAKLKEQM
jgi:putative addiction module component (TIGR02574 family)